MASDANNYDLAVGTSRIHAMTSPHFQNHKIFCFDRSQNIANYSVSLLVRNDVDLITKINAMIRNIIEGGLITKWHKENRLQVKPEAGHTVTDSLGLQYISALFYFVYFPGIITSTAVFFVEWFVARKLKQRRRLKLWRYMSHWFDGRRHMWKLNVK